MISGTREDSILKGVYLLILHIRKNTKIRVGSLGIIDFKKGFYIYVGSAQNNLIKRIQRHCLHDKKVRWHIDYLTVNENVTVKKVLINNGNRDKECRTALILSKTAEEVRGFGSSDCKCSSHLFKVGSINGINVTDFNELKLRRIEKHSVQVNLK
jgi:Uri superfamily endonuclease